MSDSVVAFRYAKALIDLANEKGVVELVNKDMTFFEEICNQNDEFKKVMANPIIRHEKKLNILNKIFKNNVHDVTFSIFNVLTKKNRESLIYSIAKEFQNLFNIQNNIQVATVSTVSELTDEQRKSFQKLIADSTGKSVVLQEKVDESLIGGYLLRINDTQIDTSVKKKLNELKLSLT